MLQPPTGESSLCGPVDRCCPPILLWCAYLRPVLSLILTPARRVPTQLLVSWCLLSGFKSRINPRVSDAFSAPQLLAVALVVLLDSGKVDATEVKSALDMCINGAAPAATRCVGHPHVFILSGSRLHAIAIMRLLRRASRSTSALECHGCVSQAVLAHPHCL